MLDAPIVLASAGALAVLGSWVAYLATIPSGNVPAKPVGSVIAQLIGVGLAAAAIALRVQGGQPIGAAVVVPASFATMMATFFVFLLTQRKTPIGAIRIKVGDPLPPFAAQTADGAPFHTDSLNGRRILLKFFRGHW